MERYRKKQRIWSFKTIIHTPDVINGSTTYAPYLFECCLCLLLNYTDDTHCQHALKFYNQCDPGFRMPQYDHYSTPTILDIALRC